MYARSLSFVFSISLIGLAAGCPDGGDAVDAGPIVDAGGATDEDSGVQIIDCEAGTGLAEIAGTVSDGSGTPISGALSQACLRVPNGALLCLQPTPVDEDGAFSIAVPETAECVTNVVARTFHPLNAMSSAYCELELPDDPGSAGAILNDNTTLHFLSPATGLPAREPEADIRTVTFSDGLDVSFQPSEFFADYDLLAASRLDPASDEICLNGEEAFDGMFAMFPEGQIDGAFDMTFANIHGLPAGATAELYVLGGLFCELIDGSTVEEGHWEQFGVGTVSPDGTVIEATGDNGLPCWTTFGYRIVPQ